MAGVANPNFKDGKYSQYVKGTLLNKYQESISAKNLLSLRDDVGYIETLIKDAIEQVSEGAGSWTAVRKLIECARVQQEAGELDADGLLDAIEQICDAAAGKERALAEIRELVQTKAKLIDSEMRRKVQARELADKAEVTATFAFICQTLRRVISDQQMLQEIQVEFLKHPMLSAPEE